MYTDTTFRVDPFTATVFTVSGKNQDMVPSGATVVHQKAKVTGQKLGFIDCVRVIPLALGACVEAHANRSLVGPIRKAGAIKTEGPDGSRGTGAC